MRFSAFRSFFSCFSASVRDDLAGGAADRGGRREKTVSGRLDTSPRGPRTPTAPPRGASRARHRSRTPPRWTPPDRPRQTASRRRCQFCCRRPRPTGTSATEALSGSAAPQSCSRHRSGASGSDAPSAAPRAESISFFTRSSTSVPAAAPADVCFSSRRRPSTARSRSPSRRRLSPILIFCLGWRRRGRHRPRKTRDVGGGERTRRHFKDQLYTEFSVMRAGGGFVPKAALQSFATGERIFDVRLSAHLPLCAMTIASNFSCRRTRCRPVS